MQVELLSCGCMYVDVKLRRTSQFSVAAQISSLVGACGQPEPASGGCNSDRRRPAEAFLRRYNSARNMNGAVGGH